MANTNAAYRIRFPGNNASTTIVTAPLLTGETSVEIADATNFSDGGGASATYLSIITFDDGTEVEICHVIGISGTTLTLDRAKGGTSSPASFAIGTIVEHRVTQELLEYLDPQAASSTGSIQIGRSATSDDTNAIAIGESASAGTTLFTAEGAIAIGAGARAIYNGNIAIGLNALADTLNNSIAIGEDANASGDAAIAIGENAEATSASTVGIGAFVNAKSTGGVAIGYSADIVGATNGVAIGYQSWCAGSSGVAIGDDSFQDGNSGVAIGEATEAQDGSVCIGYNSKSNAYHGVALGYTVRNSHMSTFKSLPSVLTREDGTYAPAGDAIHLMGTPMTLAFPPMDLGVPQTWSATTFLDQEVVLPLTAPVGNRQYYLCVGKTASDPATHNYYRGNSFTSNESTEITEPGSWGTTQGQGVDATFAQAQWVMIDPMAGVELDVTTWLNASGRFKFLPTRLGFFAYEITGDHSGQKPTFDFGNETTSDEYLSGVTVDLTLDNQIQWFTVKGNTELFASADTLKITLTTAGTGLKFMGKFIVEGMIMALRG
jgi:hypothetical protein